MESLAVEMLDIFESSSMPRLARELSPSSVNSLLCFGSLLVFVLISWDTGIHLNCFIVVSGIWIHRFSQWRTYITESNVISPIILVQKHLDNYDCFSKDDDLVHTVHHPLDVLLPALPGLSPR